MHGLLIMFLGMGERGENICSLSGGIVQGRDRHSRVICHIIELCMERLGRIIVGG